MESLTTSGPLWGITNMVDTPMLKAMYLAQIFSISRNDDGRFELREACDGYYTATLTRDEIANLANEMLALASVQTT